MIGGGVSRTILTGNGAHHGWHFELLQQLRNESVGGRLHSEGLASMSSDELHAAVRSSLRQEGSAASKSSKLKARSKL